MPVKDFPFFCYLSSDADKQLFSRNNNSDFVNQLEYPLHPRENAQGRLFAKIKSIAIWHYLQEGVSDEDTHLLKIKLNELEHNPAAQKFDQLLTTIPFTPIQEDQKYKVVELQHTSFLPLRSLPLHHLHITLLNAKDEKLKLADSHYPTIICLEISDMDSSTDFTLTCSSKEDKLSPKNTLYSFTHQLPRPMHLEDYEVALGDIFYPRTLREKHVVWFDLTFKPHDPNKLVNHVHFTFDINKMRTENRPFASNVVFSVLRNHFWAQRVRVRKGKRGEFIRFSISSKVFVEEEGQIFIRFSENFHLASRTAQPLSGRLTPLTGANPQKIEGPFDYSRLPYEPTTLVTCSLIEECFYMGRHLPLLRIAPMPKMIGTDNGDVIGTQRHFRPEHPVYHRIKNLPIYNIQFELLTPKGKLNHVQEVGSQDGIVITLLFRKRQPRA